ncbi:MAG: hypothetical protein HY293_06800 [Planctomycetes bacterium]|nr:hypothetical protein [Planctomycetota bacterium]
MRRYFDAFAWPFRGGNPGVLVLGVAVLSLGPLLLAFVPGALGLGLNLCIMAYYAIYLRSILHASMEGDDRFPAWPEIEHPTDLVEELFSILAPFLVAFLPLLLLRVGLSGIAALDSMGFLLRSAVPAAISTATPVLTILSAALFLFGWLYLPMAILVWTFYGGSSILNPVAVARAAWQTGGSYLMIVVLVAGMVTAAWSVTLIPGKFITTFGASLLTFYALVVAMRLLGTHYRIHRERLGWERRAPEPV